MRTTLFLSPALLFLTASLPATPAAPATPVPPSPRVSRAVWPVDGRPVVLRGWQPPATPYGPGHRGVDLAAPPGTPVRAVAPARVTFAGRVAGTGVVTLALTDTGSPPLRTTYEPVRPSVRQGEQVAAGRTVGTLDGPSTPPHCSASCLHWGLLRASTYLNPLSLLRTGPSRLLPVLGVPLP